MTRSNLTLLFCYIRTLQTLFVSFFSFLIIKLTEMHLFYFSGPPHPPKILNNHSQLATGRIVTVMWARSGHKNCNITMYSIHYRVIWPTTEKWVDINITNASVTSYELNLQYSRKYSVIVFAWNKLGRSAKSNIWKLRTAQGKTVSRIQGNQLLRF